MPVSFTRLHDIDWTQIKRDFDASLARHLGITEEQTMAPQPPRGGNSPQPPLVPSILKQQQPPRDLHPAAAEAVAKYSAVWDENERLNTDNVKLASDNEVLRRVDAEKTALIANLRQQLEDEKRASDDRLTKAETHLRERLAEAERNKERYLRYAVSISERLKSCGENIAAAHDIAMDMAQSSPKLDDIEQEIAKVTRQVQEKPF